MTNRNALSAILWGLFFSLAAVVLMVAPLSAESLRQSDVLVSAYRPMDTEKDFSLLLEKMRWLVSATRESDAARAGKLEKLIETCEKAETRQALRNIAKFLAEEKVAEIGPRQKEIVSQIESLLKSLENAAALSAREKLRAAVEKSVTEIRDKQNQICADTAALDKRLAEANQNGGSPSRADLQWAQELAFEESELACKVSDLLDLLKVDNTSLVLPATLKQIYDDLKLAEANLSKTDTSRLTQMIQASIVKNLEQILQTLKDTDAAPAAPDRAAPQRRGDQPLFSPMAELHLLKMFQADLSERARIFNALLDGREPTESERLLMTMIAERQETLAALTELLRRKMDEPR